MKIKKLVSVLAAVFVISVPFYGNSKFQSYDMTAYAVESFEFVDAEDYTDISDDISPEIDIIEFSTNASSDINEEENGSYSAAAARSYNPFSAFFLSLIIGIIAALIAVSIMRSSMRSVHKKQGAADYRKENGFKLDVKTDNFLGKRVEKSPVMRAEAPNSQNQSR